jgi:serine phosphatase RsbU (regulator of sigma subunit)/HAMP domain-containing protein
VVRVRLGLRQKLVVLVLVILVPLLVLLAFNLYRHFTHLEEEALGLHVRDARTIGASLDRYVIELGDVGRTAGLALVETGARGEAANAYLRSVRNADINVSDVAFADPSGRIVAAALPSAVGSDVAAEPAFRSVAAGAGFAVTDLRRNASGNLGFAVFARVEKDGRLAGVTEVDEDARDVGGALPSTFVNSAVIITDSVGHLLYSSRSQEASLTEAQRLDWHSPGVTQALAGRDFVTPVTTLPGLPGRWLGAVVPASETGWTIGLFDPSGAALAAVSSEVLVTIVATVLVLGVSLLAARQYGRAITDPLERLIAATEEIERGRFDAEVPVTTHDEIGELAENFRTMQESLKHTLSDVQVLAESARWMSSTLDLDSIARAAADYLERIIAARAVVITLADELHPGKTRLLAPHLSPEVAEQLAAAGEREARRLDLARRSSAVCRIDPPPAVAAVAPGARMLVLLPLVVNRKLIGRIDALAAPTAPATEFASTDVPLAASLAQQVASAAENAILFAQQRAIADTLQDSLLTKPYRIPELDIGLIYHQATVGGRIGGDFYDFIPVAPGCTAVVIGDITGKGLQAARYTTITKGAIRSFALDDPDPATVLGRASRVIAEQIGVENFVTGVYMLFDLRDGSLTYAVAGHPPPILHRVAANVVDALPGGGLPLGIDRDQGYEDCRTCMDVGDRLLLYTDGLSEARRGKELFGIERVGEALRGFAGLPVGDVASGIAEGAIAYAGGELQDDLAIIVLERCAPRPSAGGGTTA